MFTTPDWTSALRFSGSTSRIRFIREVPTTTPPLTARAPPESPVPGPLGNHGDPVAVKDSGYLGRLGGIGWKNHGLRRQLVGRLGVGLVDQEPIRVADDPLRAHGRCQLRQKDEGVKRSPVIFPDIRECFGIHSLRIP